MADQEVLSGLARIEDQLSEIQDILLAIAMHQLGGPDDHADAKALLLAILEKARGRH
jgi:hypothetical protein